MKKKLLYVAMAIILLLPAGCSSTAAPAVTDSPAQSATAPATETATAETKLPDAVFTYFIPDQTAKIPPDDAPVMKQIYDLTGVRIKRVIPPAEPLERLNVMLATDDLTDLIRFDDSTIMQQFITAKKIVRLNDLMQENCPNILTVNWADFKNRLVDKDGNLYFMPRQYTLGGMEYNMPESNRCFNVRTGLFEEIGYDKIPKTLSDYKALLETVKTKYPEMSPISLALGAQGQLEYLAAIGAGAYGLGEADGLVLSNGKLIHITQSPEIKEFFAFLNGLNVEGLMDIESPVLSTETLKQKAVAGKVWSYIGPGWEINSEVIAYEAGKGSKEQMIYTFPKANDSVAKVTYTRAAFNLYNTGVTITTKCADPARYLKFYDFCNTEIGHISITGTVDWNFTGENTVDRTKNYNFIVQRDVEYIPGRPFVNWSAWTGEMWGSDENWWWNWGVECMYDFTYGAGNYPNGKYDTMGNLDVGVWWDENTTRIWNAVGWTGLSYYPKMKEMYVETSEYANLQMDPASDEYADKLAIQRVLEKSLPRVIMAKSSADFDTEWAAMAQELDKEGLQAYLAKSNELYNARVQQWSAGK